VRRVDDDSVAQRRDEARLALGVRAGVGGQSRGGARPPPPRGGGGGPSALSRVLNPLTRLALVSLPLATLSPQGRGKIKTG
jgi:hypothetical protein